MAVDNEGFLYPTTDIDACINCNACNRVCPVIKLYDSEPLKNFPAETKAFAAHINDNNILLNSSSGGIFTALASEIIKEGGAVYGAAWVNGKVRHIKVTKLSEICQLRGSKYVQSYIGNCFVEIKELLRQSHHVLFSGTPCQVAGLRSYLNKGYETLLTVEVACHGAPSPKVLQKYMQELREQYSEDIKLDFRSKLNGDWRNYKVTAYSGDRHFFYEGPKENIFMKGFLRELYSRPICHECPFKAGTSGADITLADFWGIENICPSFPFHQGVNLVLTHSFTGANLFNKLDCLVKISVPLLDALKNNDALIHNDAPHPERAYFFNNIDKKSLIPLIEICLHLRTLTRLKIRTKGYIKKLFSINKNISD